MAGPPSSPPCSAIIVAAGSSRRMGFDKLSAPLAGIPVLLRTIGRFLETEAISDIVVVCPEERWNALEVPGFAKPVIRVDGGEDRQSSVARGLAALPAHAEYVAVQDGARPLADSSDIGRCIAAARESGAAAMARRVAETLKRSDEAGFSQDALSRENLWFMETPQIFSSRLLREAYDLVFARGLTITDEVSALEVLGKRVKFVESSRPNLKITTPADLALAEALLR